MIKQCVILCGGLGSRLGELTKNTPKPLLPVAGRPFLEWQIREVVRQGIRHILLLAAFEAEQVSEFASRISQLLNIKIDVVIEPERAGTGGALWNARDFLEETFILLNGDSFFDVLLSDIVSVYNTSERCLGVLSLREVDDASRFGVVELNQGVITAFSPRPLHSGAGLVNGGVYVFNKEIIASLQAQCSLESDVIPLLVETGRLRGVSSRAYFIDIGVPESYERSQTEIPKKLIRPAVFFDRDGVLNVDHGHVGTKERFEWQTGAREAVRAVNKAGYFVFVFTNQAGIGKGYYSEADFHQLMAFMQEELSAIGAHVDDIRYCPYHPEAKIDEFRRESDWRKPSAGMLHDLMRNWDVDVKSSFVVGDKESDILAATNANLQGFLFQDGNLLDFLKNETPFKEDRT